MLKVSIYIPTCNRLSLLKRAVQSVFDQSYPHWELIIVDDASNDDTWDYLQELEKNSEKVKVFRNAERKGACHSRNRAIKAARGDFVTGLDDDDEFMPKRLEVLLSVYEPDYAFVCSGFYWVTERKRKKVMCSSLHINLNQQLNANHATNQVLVERERILEIGGFDESFVSLQDYDCFTRLVEKFGPAFRYGIPLLNVNVGHGQARISKDDSSREGFKQYLEKHGHNMTEEHKLNHQFWLKVRTKEPFKVGEIIKSLKSGYVLKKIKHFIRYY